MCCQTFKDDNELPSGKEIIVIKPSEYDEDALSIGTYLNGIYLEKPDNMLVSDPTDSITNYLDQKPVYVQNEVKSLYDTALECAEIRGGDNVNLLTIADNYEEKLAELGEEQEEEY